MERIAQGYTLFRDDLDHVLAQVAEADWNELRSARVFITGGTGFFGIWLLEALLWANETLGLQMNLEVLSRSPEQFLSNRAPHLRNRPGLHFTIGSLTDYTFPVDPCTHILHAASETNLAGSGAWAEMHLLASLDGTRRLIEMAIKHDTKSILITTSGAVYSNSDSMRGNLCVEGPSGIQDFTSEKSVYGQSKRMMEVMTSVAAQAHGFKALIARCFAFVGPYLPLESNYAIGNFIRDALADRQIIVGGDGTPLRSYLYSADLVIWLLTILARGRSGVPYNVGGDEVVSIGELAHRVAKVAGRANSVTVKGVPVQGAAPASYLPSLARAHQELGVIVGIPLDEAILRTMQWHRQRL